VTPPDADEAAAYEAALAAVNIGELKPLTQPIELRDYDPHWPVLYAREETRIRAALGDRVVRIEHTGSTSVPGLAAKAIIDIALEVPDTTDEASYVPDLERAGYILRRREPDWYEHRAFKGPDTNTTVHTFSAGCEEFDRMVRFRNRLRADADDRALYEATKRELASSEWTHMQQYADAKTDVVREILRRAEATAP
jgi:GrpB-like predicted nucleotidyltransferase (UPF0157 family)